MYYTSRKALREPVRAPAVPTLALPMNYRDALQALLTQVDETERVSRRLVET